jgi:cytoskeletal protein RodZ
MTIAKVKTHKERRARYGTIGLSALVLATITAAVLWNQLHLQPFEFVTTVSAQSSVKSVPQEASQGLHIALEPRMGDLDAMIKRREIRALVVYSRALESS